MSQEDDRTPAHEYARANGLAIDYKSLNPLQSLNNKGYTFDIPEELQLYQPPPFKELLCERLQISKDALQLLASVSKRPSDDGQTQFFRWCEDLRLELPIMKTDPEMDTTDFVKPIVPDLQNEILPIELVDIEADEGLEWPSWCKDLTTEMMARIEGEKLNAEKDAVRCLHEAIEIPDGKDISTYIDACHIAHKQKDLLDPITPPLLPITPEFKPLEPSSEVGRMEMLSEHTSLSRKELDQLDKQLLGLSSDLPISETDPCHTIIAEMGAVRNDTTVETLRISTPTPKSFRGHQQTDEGKMDTPLTPPTSGPFPLENKQVPSQNAIVDITMKQSVPQSKPKSCPISSYSSESSSSETLQPIDIEPGLEIEPESPSKSNIVIKVDVPRVEITAPKAPWELHHLSHDEKGTTTRQQISKARSALEKYSYWHINGQKQQSLRWAPFRANLTQFSTHEEIVYNGSLDPLIKRPSFSLDKEMVRLTGGSRGWCDKDSDIEELAAGDLSEPVSLSSLMRKRRYKLEEKHVITAKPCNDQDLLSGKSNGEVLHVGNTVPIAFEPFDMFHDLPRIAPKRRRTKDLEVAKQEQTLHPLQQYAGLNEPISKLLARPDALPTLLQPPGKSSVIVSTSIIHRRILLAQIQYSLPDLLIVERDFTAEHDFKRHQIDSVHEADILISASTGIVLTSLQKLHQRPLPGYTAPIINIRTRLHLMAPRYSLVLVLISQGQSDSMSPVPLSTSDATAIASFAAFSRSSTITRHGTEIQPVYVSGGEHMLGQWISSLIAEKSLQTSTPFQLLEEETSWEIWLRSLGFNAVAAQVILTRFKDPNGTGKEFDHGLAVFVCMSEKQRLAEFADVLESRALIRRASRVLDMRWTL